jgi:hypothetical protein
MSCLEDLVYEAEARERAEMPLPLFDVEELLTRDDYRAKVRDHYLTAEHGTQVGEQSDILACEPSAARQG